jgi:hypothetical protein
MGNVINNLSHGWLNSFHSALTGINLENNMKTYKIIKNNRTLAYIDANKLTVELVTGLLSLGYLISGTYTGLLS